MLNVGLVLVAAACSAPPPAQLTPVPVGEVLDRGALIDALSPSETGLPAGDTVLALVGYDEDGRLDAVRISKHPSEGPLTAAVERIASPSAAPLTTAQFILIGGPQPEAVDYTAGTEVEPVLLNSEELAERIVAFARSYPGRTVQVRLLVGADGQVEDAEIVRTSGVRPADVILLDIARSARFSPAQIDQFRVPVSIQMPLGIRLQRQ